MEPRGLALVTVESQTAGQGELQTRAVKPRERTRSVAAIGCQMKGRDMIIMLIRWLDPIKG
ncbi:hypothetical protein BIWAKO_00154 [Bosea sp. BIWAKO-01]|nr:hypothetical protein BIWAKO_00154 [Bosea sp. BIWAKO-01]